MSPYNKLKNFMLVTLPVKLRKRVALDYFNKSGQYNKRALLYYKTDSLYSRHLAEKSVHTNDAEIIEMVNVLDELGFIVDVIDRAATRDQLEKLKGIEYDLFISNIAGNSCPQHNYIMSFLKVKKFAAYVMGPEPVLSSELVNKRHETFEKRTGTKCVYRRLVTGKTEDIEKRFEGVDAFYCNGTDFSPNSYRKKYNKPVYWVPSAISEKLKTDVDYSKKDPKSFLYFGGNGLICKGLDLVLEAFEPIEDYELHVCGPPTEEDFWNHYGDYVKSKPNIHYHGFMDVGSERFYNILGKTGFNLFPSCSEGCATSVLTAMRVGVVPVVTYESDVDVKDFGTVFENDEVETIRKEILRLGETSKEELGKLARKTWESSLFYTMESFRSHFKQAVEQTMAQD